MKLDNNFISAIINNHKLINKQHCPDISEYEWIDYNNAFGQVMAWINLDSYNRYHKINFWTDDDILSYDVNRYVKTVSVMNTDTIDWLLTLIKFSSYNDQQKDIYRGIIFYLKGLPVGCPGPFVDYVRSEKYKDTPVEKYNPQQLFSGMFDYSNGYNIIYDKSNYRSIIHCVDNMKINPDILELVKCGHYVDEDGLKFLQTWPPFQTMVKYHVKYLLFGTDITMFDRFYNYFEPQDLIKIGDVIVSDSFIHQCISSCETIFKVKFILPDSMKTKLFDKIRHHIEIRKISLLQQIEKLDEIAKIMD